MSIQDAKAAKVLNLLRKHYDVFRETKRLDTIEAALANYETALEAARKAGYGKLANAFDAFQMLNDPITIRTAKRVLINPDQKINAWFKAVEGFEDILTH